MEIVYDAKSKDYVCKASCPAWVVKAVEPRRDYTLLLTFTGGEKRIYNARPLLEKAIYAPLKNLLFFLGARVDGDTVIWSEDIDIAPEHLYQNSKPTGGVDNA